MIGIDRRVHVTDMREKIGICFNIIVTFNCYCSCIFSLGLKAVDNNIYLVNLKVRFGTDILSSLITRQSSLGQ